MKKRKLIYLLSTTVSLTALPVVASSCVNKVEELEKTVNKNDRTEPSVDIDNAFDSVTIDILDKSSKYASNINIDNIEEHAFHNVAGNVKFTYISVEASSDDKELTIEYKVEKDGECRKGKIVITGFYDPSTTVKEVDIEKLADGAIADYVGKEKITTKELTPVLVKNNVVIKNIDDATHTVLKHEQLETSLKITFTISKNGKTSKQREAVIEGFKKPAITPTPIDFDELAKNPTADYLNKTNVVVDDLTDSLVKSNTTINNIGSGATYEIIGFTPISETSINVKFILKKDGQTSSEYTCKIEGFKEKTNVQPSVPGSECEVIGSFDPAIKNELRAESQVLFDELASGKKPFTITDKETLKVQLNEHLQGKTRALIVVKSKGDSVWTKNKGKVIKGIEVALNFRTHGGTNTVYHDAVKDSDLVGKTNAKGIFVEKGSEENIFVIKFYFVSSKSVSKTSYIAGPEYQVVLDLR